MRLFDEETADSLLLLTAIKQHVICGRCVFKSCAELDCSFEAEFH